MRFASVIVKQASEDIVDKGRKIAAKVLEAAEGDIEYGQGRFTVKGTDRSLTLYQVAAATSEPLASSVDKTMPFFSYPYGCHVIEMEVDPETGRYELVRYSAVDDVGRAVSPQIVDGQTHGGIAQGLGQALFEHCHYDPESGQMLSGSLMDYAIPRAGDLPSFATILTEVPSTSHPLGIRAGSESGTPPAIAASVSALVDALAGFGVKHLEMPVTAERVWRAMQAGRSQ
jgi:carbon-monoxide dehydrogenase large subunit